MSQLDDENAVLDDNEDRDIEDIMSEAYDKATAEEGGEGSGPARDENGRFAPKQDKEGTKEEHEGEQPEAQPEQNTGEEESTETIDPPASWTKETQEAFAQLPPALQKQVADREREREQFANTKAQEAAEARKQYAAFEEAVAPYREMIQREGGTPLGAVQNLLQTAASLRQDPRGTLTRLAQQYGVDLSQNPQQAQPLQAAMQRIQQLENHLNQQEQARQQSQDAEISQTIEEFAAEKDDSGNALRPHFEDVREDMAALLHAGRAKDLAGAYDMATWARPEIRQKILDAQRAEQEAEQKAASRNKVSSAKKAAGKQVKSKDGLPENEAPRSLEETMSEAYDKAVGSD